jgi:palmitoyl-protein thioesterase
MRIVTPIVFWHGMGDTCCDKIANLSQTIQTWYPGTFIHSIALGTTPDEDRRASFFGIINDQIDQVCEELKEIPQLSNGFHGVGFSQGGLFMRALLQKCPIKMVTLTTFGSPHQGTSDVPKCSTDDFNCSLMRSIVKQGVYWPWIQRKVVQAQYFRQYQNLDTYLKKCIFLPELNDEISKNPRYKERLNSLTKLILVMFEEDDMIVPKETAWFYTLDASGNLLPLREQEWYQTDSIGIKTLDRQQKLIFKKLPGGHMQIPLEFFKELIDELRGVSLFTIST